MSRSGYSDDIEPWHLIMWRGAVASSMRGARGQAFLIEMRNALDALPEKRLIREDLVTPSGEVCAMGAVCKARGLDTSTVDPEDPDQVARAVGIARAMACEIAARNDDHWYHETPEARWTRMRKWVEDEIITITPNVERDG